MAVLGVLWIVLLSIDMVRGLHGRLAVFSEMIWITFGIDFVLGLTDVASVLLLWAMASSHLLDAINAG